MSDICPLSPQDRTSQWAIGISAQCQMRTSGDFKVCQFCLGEAPPHNFRGFLSRNIPLLVDYFLLQDKLGQLNPRRM